MKTIAIAVGAALISAGASLAQVPIPPAQRGAVFIQKGDFASALATRASGNPLSALGAVRAGDDRINVDVLQRTSAEAEGPVIHDIVTEVYYVLDGGGVLETGGVIDDPQPMMTNGQPTNPANIGPSKRGTKMTGGARRHVAVGDVVMIPPGVPHRFLSLDGSVTYMVVRVNPDYERGH